MGANDENGFSNVVNTCFQGSPGNPSATPCADAFVHAGVNQLVENAKVMGYDLGQAIDQFHALAPNATLYIVGYPRIIPPDGAGCWGVTNVSAGDVPVVDAWQQAVANEQKAAAAGHGAIYVDMYEASAGHDGCQSLAADRWTNPQSQALSTGWNNHPTLAGEQAMAAALVTAVNTPPDPTGPTGPIDPTGPTGPIDPTGPTGPVDPTGPTGPIDPTGPTGPIDPTGPTGPVDPTGPTGPVDPTGPTGPVDPTGETGSTGSVPPIVTPPVPFPTQRLSVALSSTRVRPTSAGAPFTLAKPRSRGARLAVTLGVAADVEFALDRARTGRLSNGRCRKVTGPAGKRLKPCTFFSRATGSTRLALAAGETNVYLTARTGSKSLSPGRYRVRAAAGPLVATSKTFSIKR